MTRHFLRRPRCRALIRRQADRPSRRRRDDLEPARRSLAPSRGTFVASLTRGRGGASARSHHRNLVEMSLKDPWNPNRDLAAKLIVAALEGAEAARRTKLASEDRASAPVSSLHEERESDHDLDQVLVEVLARLRAPYTWALTIAEIARDCGLNRRWVGAALAHAQRQGLVIREVKVSRGGRKSLQLWKVAIE